MKTKAQSEAANANYWVGRGGTINKGCSVRVGGEGRALWLGLGAARATSPFPASPGSQRQLGKRLPRSRVPILNQLDAIQLKLHLLSTYGVLTSMFSTWSLLTAVSRVS